MIQTAMLAEKENSSKSLVCACLLHDIGHFIIEDPDFLVSKFIDGKHEEIAFNFLNNYFKEEVTEPIKLHVQAKRFLCMNNYYYNGLSEASKTSLKLQGGIMSNDEAKEFENNEFFESSIKLRKFDENAKKVGLKIKSINEYKNLLLSKLI